MIGGVTANSGKHLWWPPQGIRRGGALSEPCRRLSYVGPHPCLTPPLRPSNSDMPAETRSGGALRGWSGDAGLAPSPPTCSPCYSCVSLGFHLCVLLIFDAAAIRPGPRRSGLEQEGHLPPPGTVSRSDERAVRPMSLVPWASSLGILMETGFFHHYFLLLYVILFIRLLFVIIIFIITIFFHYYLGCAQLRCRIVVRRRFSTQLDC